MNLKPGVKLSPQVAMCVALDAADRLWRELGAHGGVIITSARDGNHSRGSLHYVDLALDFRTHNLADDDVRMEAARRLQEALGEDFDVLLESRGTANEHIHLEYQPKSL